MVTITLKQDGTLVRFFDGETLIRTCNSAHTIRMMKSLSVYYKNIYMEYNTVFTVEEE